MADRLDVETRWPELFDGLDDAQRRSVVQALAANWHEGWTPNREDVQNLTDVVRGDIDTAAFLERARAAAVQGSPATATR